VLLVQQYGRPSHGRRLKFCTDRAETSGTTLDQGRSVKLTRRTVTAVLATATAAWAPNAHAAAPSVDASIAKANGALNALTARAADGDVRGATRALVKLRAQTRNAGRLAVRSRGDVRDDLQVLELLQRQAVTLTSLVADAPRRLQLALASGTVDVVGLHDRLHERLVALAPALPDPARSAFLAILAQSPLLSAQDIGAALQDLASRRLPAAVSIKVQALTTRLNAALAAAARRVAPLVAALPAGVVPSHVSAALAAALERITAARPALVEAITENAPAATPLVAGLDQAVGTLIDVMQSVVTQVGTPPVTPTSSSTGTQSPSLLGGLTALLGGRSGAS
jgi:DNA-binding transcriptional ArsR family regulator